MRCAWDELVGIMPPWLREYIGACGMESLLEVRLRIDAPVELNTTRGIQWIDRYISKDDIRFVINTASKYSPWNSETIVKGYLTAPGGHRIGVCGEVLCRDGIVSGIREAESLCIRVAKDYPGIASKITSGKNIIILGAPGWGKTTLLRDLIRQKALRREVAVADERGELFPEGFERGKRMDVLAGAPKPQALDRLLRTMGPEYIAVDEITAEEDCLALQHAARCGVFLLATAHAFGLEDFFTRPIYKVLRKIQLFDTLVILSPDRTYRMERMDK